MKVWPVAGWLTLLITALPLRADDAASGPRPVTDPTLVTQHFHEVVARPEFIDTQDTGVGSHLQDLLSQWFRSLGRKIGELQYTSRMPAFESMLMSLLVAFSLAILIYIAFRLWRSRGWTWDSEIEAAPANEAKLRAPESYDEEIKQAVISRDWHTAWLAAWRQFLSRLERDSLVEPDRTRTNREYLGQLRDRPLPATALALLTGMVDAYDRFIYGRRVIGEAEWTEFRRQLEEAALLLHLGDKRAPLLELQTA
jgi:hypothetical protein